MKIWAIADLHLAIAVPEKTMEIFGPQWHRYQERIQEAWQDLITPQDLVLVPGDISWAMHLQDALIDLAWIDALPGKKLLLRGNHDYWWPSLAKLKQSLPPSIQAIHNTAVMFNGVAIGGTRLWKSRETTCGEAVVPEDEKIYERELLRLEMSLKQMAPDAFCRIAMVHYPPITPALEPTRASTLLENYRVDHCVFGHIHGEVPPFGAARGVDYHLIAADRIAFIPQAILEL